MLRVELYDANYDKSLIEERSKCKALCFKYNNISPEKMQERKKLIKKIVGKTNGEFLIEQPFMCDYGTILNRAKIFMQTIT